MALTSLTSVASVIALMAVTGCGSSSSDASDASAQPAASESAETAPSESADEPGQAEPEAEPEAEAEDVVITISDFEYEGPETVAPGATVTVVNEDSAPHTVTSTEDKSLFDVDIEAGAETTFTAPKEPGEYAYYCEIHPEMKAVLVVE